MSPSIHNHLYDVNVSIKSLSKRNHNIKSNRQIKTLEKLKRTFKTHSWKRPSYLE